MKKRILALTLSAALLLALLCACGGSSSGGNANVTINLNELWDKITALGEMPMQMDVPDEFLADPDSYGINKDDLEDYIAKMPGMMVHATEFFIAKVKDGKMNDVKAALEARQAKLDAQWALYLPDQYALVQNYKLTVNGNYIFFAISEYAEQAEKLFNDAIAAAKS